MFDLKKDDSQNDTKLEVIEATAIESMTRAEVEMQVATAKKYPRSVRRFVDDAMTMACLTPETAASMFYARPQDGKMIEGPSVRMAEIVVAAWGNFSAESLIVSQNDKSITAQATVWDIEKNVRRRLQVERSILKRNGQKFSDAMIITTGNAAMSIAYRNAVFSVIPRSYIDPIWMQAKKVAVGDAKTMVARRDDCMAWFGKIGVTPDRVLSFVEKQSVEDMTVDDIGTLLGVVTAIKSGDAVIDDIMPTIDTQEGTKKFGFQKKLAAKQDTPEKAQ